MDWWSETAEVTSLTDSPKTAHGTAAADRGNVNRGNVDRGNVDRDSPLSRSNLWVNVSRSSVDQLPRECRTKSWETRAHAK